MCMLTPEVHGCWCWGASVETKRCEPCAEHSGAVTRLCHCHLSVCLGRPPSWAGLAPRCARGMGAVPWVQCDRCLCSCVLLKMFGKPKRSAVFRTVQLGRCFKGNWACLPYTGHRRRNNISVTLFLPTRTKKV